MFERIYAGLLRLFPPHFRVAYGDEALQLFRDRLRDEQGFLPRLRPWLDLLADIAVSLPREYRTSRQNLAGALVPLRTTGLLSFRFHEGKPPHLGLVLLGGMLSLATFGFLPALISHYGNGRPLGPYISPQARAGFASFSNLRPPPPPASAMPETAAATSGAMAGSGLDAAERRRVIDAVVENLKQHYIDPAAAETMAETLREHEKKGDDNAVADGAGFAQLLTSQMRAVSHDPHLEVVYSPTVLPQPTLRWTPEALARYRQAMAQQNCTFETVRVLPHNIGYLKLNSFPEVSVCESTAREAMASLSNADAIIFDLRDNRGGFPDMVALMAAYLFDHPEYFYNPRENTTERSWTKSPVAGNKLADKPAYVLTSARTISGAEQFTYNMKMLKRATLIGERTGGAAHAGVFYRIDDHFGIAIPETQPINPFSKADWEGTGVEPDVRVNASDALNIAEKMALKRLLSP